MRLRYNNIPQSYINFNVLFFFQAKIKFKHSKKSKILFLIYTISFLFDSLRTICTNATQQKCTNMAVTLFQVPYDVDHTLNVTFTLLYVFLRSFDYNCQLLPMKLLENSPKIAEIQSRLSKYTFLSKNNLPGYQDGLIFQDLKKGQKYPDRRQNPNFYHWYILMRQFADSTVKKWIDERLYFDADDNLLENQLRRQNITTFTRKQPLQISSPNKEENMLELKSPKLEMIEVQYVIDVLLKEYSQQLISELQKCLAPYSLEITKEKDRGDVKIKCGSQSSRCQQIANLLTKTIEYENLQVKRQKKVKNSYKEDINRQ